MGDFFAGEAPPPSDQKDRPVLRRGDKGPAVKVLQEYLRVTPDGYFGPNTEAAVTNFQRSRGLIVDGVVGGYTWAELEKQASAPAPINNPKMTNIVATMFGGSADPNKSAYDGHQITDEELGCALPYKFPKERHKVNIINRANNKSILCDIVDVGPWNTTDNYWTLPNGRPQAETGRDLKGRKTNLAGIDLTPAADKAIDLGGMGKVDWEFIIPTTGGEKPSQAPPALAAGMAEKIDQLVAAMADLTAAINSLNPPSDEIVLEKLATEPDA
jgi:peptidoglycan hydrolase-like protein with peptidoglycan-binding domain